MKIKPYKQKTKLTCGPASLKMLMEYYGIIKMEKEIIKGIGGIKKYGVLNVKLGVYAKTLNFKTKLLSYNKKLSKGYAIIKKPEVNDILKLLKKNIPVIIAVRSCLLFNKYFSKLGHFIVITDYKK